MSKSFIAKLYDGDQGKGVFEVSEYATNTAEYKL